MQPRSTQLAALRRRVVRIGNYLAYNVNDAHFFTLNHAFTINSCCWLWINKLPVFDADLFAALRVIEHWIGCCKCELVYPISAKKYFKKANNLADCNFVNWLTNVHTVGTSRQFLTWCKLLPTNHRIRRAIAQLFAQPEGETETAVVGCFLYTIHSPSQTNYLL